MSQQSRKEYSIALRQNQVIQDGSRKNLRKIGGVRVGQRSERNLWVSKGQGMKPYQGVWRLSDGHWRATEEC